MRKLLPIAVAGLIALTGATAHAVTIDFEAFANNQDITGVDLGGVSITAGVDPVVVTTSNLGGSPNQIDTEPFTSASPFRADFTSAASMVSVDLGDFNADADDIFLQAFSAANVLLDSDAFSLPGSFVGLHIDLHDQCDITIFLVIKDHLIFGFERTSNGDALGHQHFFKIISHI